MHAYLVDSKPSGGGRRITKLQVDRPDDVEDDFKLDQASRGIDWTDDATIGGAIGVMIAAVLIGAGAWWFIRYRRRQNRSLRRTRPASTVVKPGDAPVVINVESVEEEPVKDDGVRMPVNKDI